MTRLSDSLHGLADRAPLDGMSVSTVAATRRINRSKRLRAAANATAGVGVAAVIALAVINPGIQSRDAADSAASLDTAKDAGGAPAPQFDAGASSEVAWGVCGTRPLDAEVPMVSDTFTLTLGQFAAEAEPGSTVDTALTVTRNGDVAFASTGATYLVLWDGNVVGIGFPSPDTGLEEMSDNTANVEGTLALVNCWDGAALPGGKYEVVAYQDFYADVSPVPGEPSVAPTEPATEPATPPATAPDATASDATVSVSPDAATEDVQRLPSGGGIVGPAADAPAERAVSNPVELIISGDVPENPFGDYLQPLQPAVVYPDDYLTPSAARAEFAARTTLAPWDMEKGSQRVVKTGDSLTESDPNAWLDSYYGCSPDGTSQPSFPTTSAQWPLISVDATLPASVKLSYGWVVNDNPAVDVKVTNTSDFSLPGFWGQPSTTLYLVKDGTVVASSYLTPTDPNGYASITSSGSQDGMLAPDASIGGTFLWREVNGCWTGNSQYLVKTGTYTVLAVQDVYLDGGTTMYPQKYAVPEGDLGIYSDSSIGSASSSDGASVDVARLSVAPAPDSVTYDYVSLQVWTSLGQVTLK